MYEQRKRDHLEVEKRAHSGVIEDLHLKLSLLKDEVASWKEKYGKLEEDYRQRESLEFKNKDLEKKNNIILDELEKISLILKEKVMENEELRASNIELKQNAKAQEFLQGEIQRLREIVDERSLELENWRIKCSRIEIELSEKDSLGRKVLELDGRAELLISEIERLNKLLREKNSEIDDWRMRYSKLELITKESASIKEENIRLRQLLDLKMNEIDEVCQKLSYMEMANTEKGNIELKKKESDSRVSILITELERLREIDREKDEKIAEMALGIRKLEIDINSRSQTERELLKVKGKKKKEN